MSCYQKKSITSSTNVVDIVCVSFVGITQISITWTWSGERTEIRLTIQNGMYYRFAECIMAKLKVLRQLSLPLSITCQ